MVSGQENKNVNVIQDEAGRSIVLINDIRFKSRRTIDWTKVEEYLKEYIGSYYEILETAEKVFIGTDFPDEFCHSQDKIRLKGANVKADISPKRKKDGIVMTHVLEFQRMIQKENWYSIIFTQQECWLDVIKMELYIYMIS